MSVGCIPSGRPGGVVVGERSSKGAHTPYTSHFRTSHFSLLSEMSGPGSVSGPAINTAGGPKCLAAAFQASGRPGGVVVGEKDQTALIRLIVIFSQGEASERGTAMVFMSDPG